MEEGDSDEVIGLSPRDVEVVAQTIDIVAKQQPVRAGSTPDPVFRMSADTCIAKIPDDADPAEIPALDTDTDTLGSLLCDIYKLVQEDMEDPESVVLQQVFLDYHLEDPVEPYQLRVYNYKDTAFTSTNHFEIKRTKSGFWVPASSSGSGDAVICKAVSEVAARSGTTPGSGDAVVWKIGESDELEETEETITIYNLAEESAVAADVFLQAKKDRDGHYLVDWEECVPEEDSGGNSPDDDAFSEDN